MKTLKNPTSPKSPKRRANNNKSFYAEFFMLREEFKKIPSL